MVRTLLSAVLALGVAAAPAFGQTPQAVPGLTFEQPTVTVLSTGSGPKRLLRYKVPAGTKDRIDMTYAFTFAEASMDGPGLPADDMRMSMRTAMKMSMARGKR